MGVGQHLQEINVKIQLGTNVLIEYTALAQPYLPKLKWSTDYYNMLI